MQGTWQASAVPVTLSFVNMALLAFAMREISAGTAYAIWTGLGAVGVIIGGIILFEEKVSAVQIGFMALIVIGVVGNKLFAASCTARPRFPAVAGYGYGASPPQGRDTQADRECGGWGKREDVGVEPGGWGVH